MNSNQWQKETNVQGLLGAQNIAYAAALGSTLYENAYIQAGRASAAQVSVRTTISDNICKAKEKQMNARKRAQDQQLEWYIKQEDDGAYEHRNDYL